MAEVLVTPDVETAAVAFLVAKLGASVNRVATRVPATMPDRMVRVSLTGGSRLDVASDVAQVTVECWAPDGVSASLIARTAYAHMLSAAGSTAGGVFVRRADTVGGPQFFPDPDITKPRYQFTVRWHVRPAAI